MDLLHEAPTGRSKVSLPTVYQKHSTLLTRKRMYRVWRLPGAWMLNGFVSSAKHWNEAQVNGGRNYNGPKVAKFLVG